MEFGALVISCKQLVVREEQGLQPVILNEVKDLALCPFPQASRARSFVRKVQSAFCVPQDDRWAA